MYALCRVVQPQKDTTTFDGTLSGQQAPAQRGQYCKSTKKSMTVARTSGKQGATPFDKLATASQRPPREPREDESLPAGAAGCI